MLALFMSPSLLPSLPFFCPSSLPPFRSNSLFSPFLSSLLPFETGCSLPHLICSASNCPPGVFPCSCTAPLPTLIWTVGGHSPFSGFFCASDLCFDVEACFNYLLSLKSSDLIFVPVTITYSEVCVLQMYLSEKDRPLVYYHNLFSFVKVTRSLEEHHTTIKVKGCVSHPFR